MNNRGIVVIKVGSQLMIAENGAIVKNIAAQVSLLQKQGFSVVVISSGAVAMGKEKWRSQGGALQRDSAFFASIGQLSVFQFWDSQLLSPVAQVLVDREHLSFRPDFLKTQTLMIELIAQGVIPIINENDALNSGNKKLGNNDLLSAYVANMLKAHTLILLTDVSAIFEDYPKCQKPIHECHVNDIRLTTMIKGAHSKVGTGGMLTKLKAAQLVAVNGTTTLICNEEENLASAIEGQMIKGTRLVGDHKPLNSSQVWLSGSSHSRGKLHLDQGAVSALRERNASLLLPGLRSVEGVFQVRDVVDLINLETGEVVGKGYVRKNSTELERLLYQEPAKNRWANADSILVHRNDLVILS